MARPHPFSQIYIPCRSFLFQETGGKTYSGLKWKFHHYGPWKLSCFQRIEAALTAIHAEKREIESQYFEPEPFAAPMAGDVIIEFIGYPTAKRAFECILFGRDEPDS